jgi:NAD(P)-dependent dehydrogenase (short-subunit alcohol dehydrogenase family)
MSRSTIIITGISKGIGLAIGQRFQAEGYHVVGCASTPESLKQCQQLLPDAELHQCNMGDKAALLAFADICLARYADSIDTLVNNAGRFWPGAIHQEEDSVYEETMRLNVDGPYYLTKRLIPAFIAKQSGNIINMCSTASYKAYPNGGSYCISKYALLGMTKVLREELKPFGIRVISIAPGPTLTDSWTGTPIPDSRFMTAQDVADVVWMSQQLPKSAVIEEVIMRPLLGDIDSDEFE